MSGRMGGVSDITRVSRPPMGGMGGPSSGGMGDGPAAPVPSLQVFPWWYYPPPASQYLYVDTLDATGASQVIAAGAQNVELAGAGLEVGQGEKAVIVGVGLVVQIPTATDNYFFTMLRNGGPVEGLRRLRNFAVAANASVREFGGYAIKLEPGDILTWTVTNNGAAAVTVSLSYQGWRANENEIARVDPSSGY